MTQVILGLGLLSIGRVWGMAQTRPPQESEALCLIERAVELGVRFFDTAPAYGPSEAVLGKSLAGAGGAINDLTIATKMGEHWVGDREGTYVDHSFEALKESLDRSLDLLGKIDILQIHKASVQALQSDSLPKAIEYAKNLGITKFGASVSDLNAGKMACDSGEFSYLQFPFNERFQGLVDLFALADETNVLPIVNRPLAMGGLIPSSDAKPVDAIRSAFTFVNQHMNRGVILTGTRSAEHLTQTLSLFDS